MQGFQSAPIRSIEDLHYVVKALYDVDQSGFHVSPVPLSGLVVIFKPIPGIIHRRCC